MCGLEQQQKLKCETRTRRRLQSNKDPAGALCTDMKDEGKHSERGRCSVLLELYVIWWLHVYFSLADVSPVGAQDSAT